MPGPNRFTEGLLEIGDTVASTLAANGEIRVNVGNATLGTGIDSSVPFWGTDGFLSRPADPTPAGAAQYLFYPDGNQRYGIGSRDRRFLSQAGMLDPGDRSIYTSTGARIFLDASAPAIVLRVTDGCVATLSATSLDVKGAGSVENVALYETLRAQTNALQTFVDLLSNPAVGTGILATLIAAAVLDPATKTALTTALAAAYATLTAANTNESNPAVASSAVLRASPT